jgi:hypothetical protein
MVVPTKAAFDTVLDGAANATLLWNEERMLCKLLLCLHCFALPRQEVNSPLLAKLYAEHLSSVVLCLGLLLSTPICELVS